MSQTWTRIEYFQHKEKLESDGIQIILVDMSSESVVRSDKRIEGSVLPSDALFFDTHYADGTVFVLYCDTGCTLAGHNRQQLEQTLPQYTFVDISGGASMYDFEKSNFLYEKRLS